MITWLLVAPTAVLIARLGRGWGKWFTWHSSIQVCTSSSFGVSILHLTWIPKGYFTFPATCLIVALGMGATHEGGSSGVDAHTVRTLLFELNSNLIVRLCPDHRLHNHCRFDNFGRVRILES